MRRIYNNSGEYDFSTYASLVPNRTSPYYEVSQKLRHISKRDPSEVVETFTKPSSSQAGDQIYSHVFSPKSDKVGFIDPEYQMKVAIDLYEHIQRKKSWGNWFKFPSQDTSFKIRSHEAVQGPLSENDISFLHNVDLVTNRLVENIRLTRPMTPLEEFLSGVYSIQSGQVKVSQLVDTGLQISCFSKHTNPSIRSFHNSDLFAQKASKLFTMTDLPDLSLLTDASQISSHLTYAGFEPLIIVSLGLPALVLHGSLSYDSGSLTEFLQRIESEVNKTVSHHASNPKACAVMGASLLFGMVWCCSF